MLHPAIRTFGLSKRYGRFAALDGLDLEIEAGVVFGYLALDLLILDEPTTGLDPLMQREFLALVREARDEGTTILLSSHILDEVETVADVVGILRAGRLVVVEAIDALKAKALRRIDVMFTGEVPVAELGALDGVREVRAVGTTAHLTVAGSTEDLFWVAAPHGIRNVVSHEADLEEIFVAFYDRPE